ncbi:KaiC, partial [Thermoplasmatales archaeon SCGC AB-540-F20]
MKETKSLILKRKGETDGFAERFGAEIPNGSLIFMEGKEGTGKSIFCQRFCVSLLQNGHSCSYVSTQFTIKRFLRQTSSVGYNVRQYLMSGK